MRIKRFEINDFGKFHNLNTIDKLDNGLVLIYGKNEAGKTTLFELIKTLFYGFKPASREKNPNVSWKNDRIEFTCDVEMDNGDKLVIYRRLLSSPSGKIIKDGKVEEIKNYAIRQVSHISPEIYSKIFALKVEDLAEIQGEAWSEIQEKLLAGFGSEELVSVREVLKKINEESDSLFKKRKSEHQLVRKLKTIIVDLKKERNVARDSNKKIRFFDSEISRMKKELEELEEKEINLKIIIKKAKEIMPIRNIIREINRIEEKFSLKNTWLAMRNMNIEKYTEIKNNVETFKSNVEKLGKLEKSQEEKVVLFSNEDIDVYKNRVRIETFKSEYSDLKVLRSEIGTYEEELRRLSRKKRAEWENISEKDLDDEICTKIERIEIHELAKQISKLTKIKRELVDKQFSYKELKKQLEEEKPQHDYLVLKIIGAAILLAGAISTILGIAEQINIITIGGIWMSISGVIFFVVIPNIMKKKASSKGETGTLVELRLAVNEIVEEENEKCEELVKMLDAIPVSTAAMEDYTEAFISSFKTIKSIVSEIGDKQREVNKKNDRLDNLQGNLIAFLNKFEYQSAIKEEEKLLELRNRVAQIEKHKIRNEGNSRRIEEIREELEEEKELLKKQEKVLQEIEEQLRSIGGGDVEQGAMNYDNNIQTQKKIELLEGQLSIIPNYGAIIEEMDLRNDEMANDDDLIYSDYEVEKAESDITNITEKMKLLIESKKENEMLMSRILEEKTIDEIESEIIVREEELRDAYIKYDKLLLMKEIINIADERFREENQPDVLKNASVYLQKITDKKYSHIMVEEKDGELSALLVKNNHLKKRIEAVSSKLSKGTLHQLYLSLRLSLIDHLDRDKEKLPICFDELLVNWDDGRLDNNLMVLKEICNKRQVFMFTCHEWLATKIEEEFNIKRIDLEKQGD
ncbi:AAA family ATPase [bacterium AH-315-E09]|nr:AAA family ATPase [bacterium AH-315-E09]